MKEKLLIIGAVGHAKSCADVIEVENKFEIIGFVDSSAKQTNLLGYPIFCDDDLPNLFKQCKFAFLGVGQIKSVNLRINLYERLKSIGFALPTIISPLAYASKSAFIADEATIIMHHALINANASVGKSCIINTKALIEHDAIVEDFCHISTAACINGRCKVKAKSFVASNTSLKHAKVIESNSLVYHNTTLIKSAVNDVVIAGGGDYSLTFYTFYYFYNAFGITPYNIFLFYKIPTFSTIYLFYFALYLRIFLSQIFKWIFLQNCYVVQNIHLGVLHPVYFGQRSSNAKNTKVQQELR